MMFKEFLMARAFLAFLGLKFPNQPSIAPFARKMGIHLIFAFAVSNTSDVFELRLLGSHVASPMARVLLVLVQS
jgi:hypothetical protein